MRRRLHHNCSQGSGPPRRIWVRQGPNFACRGGPEAILCFFYLQIYKFTIRRILLSVLVCFLLIARVFCFYFGLVGNKTNRWRFGKFKSLSDATYFLARQPAKLLLSSWAFFSQEKPGRAERAWLCDSVFLNCFWNNNLILFLKNKMKSWRLSDVNSNIKRIVIASDLGNEVKFEQNAHTAWNVLV